MKVCAQHNHSGVGSEQWWFRLCVLALNMVTHAWWSVRVCAEPSRSEDNTHQRPVLLDTPWIHYTFDIEVILGFMYWEKFTIAKFLWAPVFVMMMYNHII